MRFRKIARPPVNALAARELLPNRHVMAERPETVVARGSRLACKPNPAESRLRVLANEHAVPADAAGKAVPESKAEQPPVIRRAEIVAFALVGLLIISVMAVLYVAKAFFLPVLTAFVVGTMLAPAARYLERHRIPRALSAVLIVSGVCAALAVLVSLISSPVMQWSGACRSSGRC